MGTAIVVENASLRFRIYRNPSPALKEAVLGAFSRRSKVDPVVEFEALRNINLSFNGGDRIGIVGLNGAGKSTLLKMLVGIYPPHKGRVRARGKITPLIELGTGFDPELSGRDNIYLSGALLGRSLQELRRHEQKIIEFSELNEFIDLPVKYYSSGMTGRLAFSIATVIEPEILLVDEIFATGDAHFVSKASKRMIELFDNSHIVVFVSHDLEQVTNLCNRAIVLHKGEVVHEGSPAAVTDFYLSRIVNQ
ncbi:MAG: ABC transporter ATP-binding protein [Candidatus Melainabacteria bacterium]|nr:ABC transporter ATP-binding protein [Candidatus Melainabacteria bacterium]